MYSPSLYNKEESVTLNPRDFQAQTQRLAGSVGL